MTRTNDPIELLRTHRTPILRLLVQVLWADRRMSPRQVAAVAAAGELLGEEDAARLITERPSEETAFAIPEPVGPLAVAAAAWVAAIDGRTHAAELTLLDTLVDELALDAEVAAQMHIIGLSRATLKRAADASELESVLRLAHDWLDDRPRAA